MSDFPEEAQTQKMHSKSAVLNALDSLLISKEYFTFIESEFSVSAS